MCLSGFKIDMTDRDVIIIGILTKSPNPVNGKRFR